VTCARVLSPEPDLRLPAVYQDRPDAGVLSGLRRTPCTFEPGRDGLLGQSGTGRTSSGRSSKPVRSCNPRLGRFDSCAAPFDRVQMAQGPFRNRVCHLSDVVFRSLVGLTAGAHRMVMGVVRLPAVYRDRPDMGARGGLTGTPSAEPERDGLHGHSSTPAHGFARLPKPRALVRFRPGASRWCASASGDARIPTHFRLRPASSLPIHPHQIVCREFRRASPSTHALPPHRLRSAASASCDSASVIAAASISSLPCQRTAVGSSFSGFTSASRSR
jgi:hypothetical protein